MRNVCPNESEKEASYVRASMGVGLVCVYNILTLIDKKMNDY